MDIIKHGNQYHIKQCKDCFCEFGYTISDLKAESYSEEYFGQFHYVDKLYVECPECEEKIYIKYFVDGESIID